MSLNQYQQLKNISTAALIEESNHVRYIFQGVVFCVLIFLALLLWASVATFKEVAVTFGEIDPEGYERVVQHLEGGIVSKVYVRDGDQVKQGQVLVLVDPTSKRAEFNQLRELKIALLLDHLRLHAYLEHKQPDLNAWADAIMKSSYTGVTSRAQIEKLLQEEKLQFDAQNKDRDAQLLVVQGELDQRKEKLKQVINQKQIWDKQLKLFDQEFNMYQELADKRVLSRRDYLSMLREMNAAKGENARLLSEIAQTQDAIRVAESSLKETEQKLQTQAHADLDVTDKKISETTNQLSRIADQLSRTEVKAPISGLVKGLRVFPGTVLGQGGQMMEIVPFNQQLIATTKINTRDIGFIKVGAKATVKILTYDFSRYGGIQGTVKEISASTFQDEDKKPYYKATIALDQQYINKDDVKRSLMPGMTVQADIVTGEKTLLEYLLKPIRVSTENAFRER